MTGIVAQRSITCVALSPGAFDPTHRETAAGASMLTAVEGSEQCPVVRAWSEAAWRFDDSQSEAVRTGRDGGTPTRGGAGRRLDWATQ
jgi:hypothetical protein